MGRRPEPRLERARHPQRGARDAGGNETSGEERLAAERRRSAGEAGPPRTPRPEEATQRNRPPPSGPGGTSPSHEGW